MRFVVFDTETSSLFRPRRIVQLAWMVLDDKARFQSMASHILKPGDFRVDTSAEAVHKISRAVMEEKGMPRIKTMNAFLKECNTPDTCLVAHNIKFDSETVIDELYALDCPEERISEFQKLRHFCTLDVELLRAFDVDSQFPYRTVGLKLENWFAALGGTQKQISELVGTSEVAAHDAGYDTAMTAVVLSKLISRGIFNPVTYFALPKQTMEVLESNTLNRQLEEVTSSGVDYIPSDQLKSGVGNIVSPELQWYLIVSSYKAAGLIDLAKEYENLLCSIVNLCKGVDQTMVKKLVYALMCRAVSHLLCSMKDIKIEFPSETVDSCSPTNGAGYARRIEYSIDTPREHGHHSTIISELLKHFDPPAVSSIGVIQRKNYTAPSYCRFQPQWLKTYSRFASGESVLSIAMHQDSFKAIKVTTVIGHLRQALLNGKPVDLDRITGITHLLPTNDESLALDRHCGCNNPLELAITLCPRGMDEHLWQYKVEWWHALKISGVTISHKDNTSSWAWLSFYLRNFLFA